MFISPNISLNELLTAKYLQKVVDANAALGTLDRTDAEAIAAERVDFLPAQAQKRDKELLKKVSTPLIEPFHSGNAGAPTDSFRKAANTQAAPLTGSGNYRVGENGKLYLLGKSEHYHTPLGHRFAGYRLIDNAGKLGIPNATHNNTRGYITRLLERRLIASVNALDWDDDVGIDRAIQSDDGKTLNRVINLETGSLAAEAGIKMMLSRFYRLDGTAPMPKYFGKTPVFFVMADSNDGLEANYHGTTILAQTFRGMWPDFIGQCESSRIYKVVPVRINDISDFGQKIRQYNNGKYKTAGFLHEIILMNYGAVRLEEPYLQQAYRYCDEYDTPVLVDEIQSCMWYKGMFLYKLYNLKPDFVVLGKGFSGGEYPASKIITTSAMDTLNQFGALVTNGQEELASLSYLITMRFLMANGDIIEEAGSRFESRMRRLKERHSGLITRIEGKGHLIGMHFFGVESAKRFAEKLNCACIDCSAQLYKQNCPPAVLFKPPVIASNETLDYIADAAERAAEDSD